MRPSRGDSRRWKWLRKKLRTSRRTITGSVEERTNISICATLWMVGLSIALSVVAIVTSPFTLGAGLVLLPVTVVGLWWAKRRVNKIERLMKEESELEARRKVLQRQYGGIEKELHSEMNRLDKAFNLTEGRFRNAATEFYVRPASTDCGFSRGHSPRGGLSAKSISRRRRGRRSAGYPSVRAN